MARTVYEEGREAYGIIDSLKCPYQDEARRTAWQQGYDDAKSDFEND